MADPELQIRGGPGHPDPEKRGGGRTQKNFFTALRASVWSKTKGWGPGPPAPSLDPPQHIGCAGFWNTGNFCWWNPESWALEFVIQLKEIRNPASLTIGIRNSTSTTERNPESSKWNAESTA